MLIQFTIENHRSIRNSAVVSFTASKDKSLDEYLLHPDRKKDVTACDCDLWRECRGKK